MGSNENTRLNNPYPNAVPEMIKSSIGPSGGSSSTSGEALLMHGFDDTDKVLDVKREKNDLDVEDLVVTVATDEVYE